MAWRRREKKRVNEKRRDKKREIRDKSFMSFIKLEF